MDHKDIGKGEQNKGEMIRLCEGSCTINLSPDFDFADSSFNLFNKYLLSILYMSGIVLGTAHHR